MTLVLTSCDIIAHGFACNSVKCIVMFCCGPCSKLSQSDAYVSAAHYDLLASPLLLVTLVQPSCFKTDPPEQQMAEL